METQDKLYIQGFNTGYTISKYEPKLLSKVVKNLRATPGYLDGVFSGKEEYDREYTREQLLGLNTIRNQSPDRENELKKN